MGNLCTSLLNQYIACNNNSRDHFAGTNDSGLLETLDALVCCCCSMRAATSLGDSLQQQRASLHPPSSVSRQNAENAVLSKPYLVPMMPCEEPMSPWRVGRASNAPDCITNQQNCAPTCVQKPLILNQPARANDNETACDSS